MYGDGRGGIVEIRARMCVYEICKASEGWRFGMYVTGAAFWCSLFFF